MYNNLSRICGKCDDEMYVGRMWQIIWKYVIQKSDLECLSRFLEIDKHLKKSVKQMSILCDLTYFFNVDISKWPFFTQKIKNCFNSSKI